MSQNTAMILQWKTCRLDLSIPALMGIINLTPDSFYSGSRFQRTNEVLGRAEEMIGQGCAILDIGAVSTRPLAAQINPEAEWERLKDVLPAVRKAFPEIILSVDTYWSETARRAAGEGVDMINDISGGQFDPIMFETVSRLNVAYVLMHIQGTPQTMQINPHYENVVNEVSEYFLERIKLLKENGFRNPLILDPGFGFGKTLEHNYQLLGNLFRFKESGYPVMVGISRKSMIYRVLGITPEEALNGTTALHTVALLNGADILRVHDVREARQVIELITFYKKINPPTDQ